MRRALLVAVAASSLLGAGCGDEPPPPQTKGAPGGPAPAAKKKDDKNRLQPRVHIEERVACAYVDKPTGPECKPDIAACEDGKYCIPAGNSFACEPCPERDAIRHEFKDRDFVADQARDPFQSFLLPQNGLEKPEQVAKPEGSCKREDQFVASSYSFQELHLVGIVSQGTQRKVLMMGPPGNYGYIIKRADCVGKEKAVVKDIGTGYITFVVDSEGKRPPTETSIPLHVNDYSVNGLPEMAAPVAPSQPSQPTAPVVAPPNAPTVAPPIAPTGPAPVVPVAPKK